MQKLKVLIKLLRIKKNNVAGRDTTHRVGVVREQTQNEPKRRTIAATVLQKREKLKLTLYRNRMAGVVNNSYRKRPILSRR